MSGNEGVVWVAGLPPRLRSARGLRVALCGPVAVAVFSVRARGVGMVGVPVSVGGTAGILLRCGMRGSPSGSSRACFAAGTGFHPVLIFEAKKAFSERTEFILHSWVFVAVVRGSGC